MVAAFFFFSSLPPPASARSTYDAEAINEALQTSSSEMDQVSRRAVSQGERCGQRP